MVRPLGGGGRKRGTRLSGSAAATAASKSPRSILTGLLEVGPLHIDKLLELERMELDFGTRIHAAAPVEGSMPDTKTSFQETGAVAAGDEGEIDNLVRH